MINKAINVGNTIGKGMSILNLIGAIIVSLLFGGVGLTFLLMKDVYTKNVTGKVTSANCYRRFGNKKTRYDCRNVSYNYVVDGTKYNGSEQVGETNTKYRKGDNIKLQYNPENIGDSRLKQIKGKYVGIFLISIAIIILLIAFSQYYFISRVRGAGSAYTAYTAYNYMTN